MKKIEDILKDTIYKHKNIQDDDMFSVLEIIKKVSGVGLNKKDINIKTEKDGKKIYVKTLSLKKIHLIFYASLLKQKLLEKDFILVL